MRKVETDSEKMMSEIMEFTQTVVGISTIKGVPVEVQAKAIFMAEQIFHKAIMNQILTKTKKAAIASRN